jgi:3-oxoacyl-[acyl-carrier-protein] synthase-1
MLVLEEMERAKAASYSCRTGRLRATSDSASMVAPSGEGAVRCMRQALGTVGQPIDYINPHGTSTPVGDIAELDAMREVFGHEVPPFSSTKSLCGHSLGAAGVQEAVHCLLMLENGFVAGSPSLQLNPHAEGCHQVKQEAGPVEHVASAPFAPMPASDATARAA